MYGLTDEDLALQSHGPGVHRRADPLRGAGGAGRRRAPGRRAREATRPRSPARPVRHQHPDDVRRPGVHVAPAGARAGAGRSGHQRARLDARALPRCGGPRWPPTTSSRSGCSRRSAARSRSATPSPRRTPAPTSQPSRQRRAATATTIVLNGEKWHVTSYNEAGYVFFQAVLTDGPNAGEHALFVVDIPTPGHGGRPHARVHPHHQPPPPDRRVRRRSRARVAPRRQRGRRHDLRLRVVPVRAADDRGALPRRGRAVDRGGDGVRAATGSSAGCR